MPDKNILLTDEQYKACLDVIKRTVEDPGFKVTIDDSDCPGNKYTSASFGFCDHKTLYKIPGVALFPEQPTRDSIKYRLRHHKCPFDGRIEARWGYDSGCYWECLGRKKRMSVEDARRIVREFQEEEIKHV
jgi:hypothetical protein